MNIENILNKLKVYGFKPNAAEKEELTKTINSIYNQAYNQAIEDASIMGREFFTTEDNQNQIQQEILKLKKL